MSNDLLTPIEALMELGLYKPGIHNSPDTNKLKILYDKGLLDRIELNSRVFRYERTAIDELKDKVKNKIVTLTF